MRGEHKACSTLWNSMRGSSPHARGTPSTTAAPSPWPRIIPACAGNTVNNGSALALAKDHPRMRGEHIITTKTQVWNEGSSPHARGTHDAEHACWDGVGIIPACAGNTRQIESKQDYKGDHPRMRGEHQETWQTDIKTMGSSPHARGTPVHRRTGFRDPGIIPACAGNTR